MGPGLAIVADDVRRSSEHQNLGILSLCHAYKLPSEVATRADEPLTIASPLPSSVCLSQAATR